MAAMVRRSITLSPDQDAFIEAQRARRGWTRSLWLQELLKRQMEAAGFAVPGDIAHSGTVNRRERLEVGR